MCVCVYVRVCVYVFVYVCACLRVCANGDRAKWTEIENEKECAFACGSKYACIWIACEVLM